MGSIPAQGAVRVLRKQFFCNYEPPSYVVINKQSSYKYLIGNVKNKQTLDPPAPYSAYVILERPPSYVVEAKSKALSSAIPYAMHPEFGGKWEMNSSNTRFPQPILLCT